MSPPVLTDARWIELLERSNEFTCYSAAMATWLAPLDDGWEGQVNPGLWLRLTAEPDGLFGFCYFPPELRARLGLARRGADDEATALAGVLHEIERNGRVIVAADGYHLPWHVAAGREHAPHWFVLTGVADRLEIADPFACRNELGTQTAERHAVQPRALSMLLSALPGTNPIHRLRELYAFGDQAPEGLERRFQWFVGAEVAETDAPAGADGPAAVRRLAEHFRAHGQDPDAYRQADDIWSVARHRALLTRRAAAAAMGDDGELAAWVAEHAVPLAKRWGHVAPLIMQATLTLAAGRPASSSVPDALDDLAGREERAAQTFPCAGGPGSI